MTLPPDLPPNGAVVLRENVPTAAYKTTAAHLAWDTFAWFVSDPDGIPFLRGNVAPSKRWLWEILRAGRVP